MSFSRPCNFIHDLADVERGFNRRVEAMVQFPENTLIREALYNRGPTAWKEVQLHMVLDFFRETEILFASLMRKDGYDKDMRKNTFTNKDIYNILLKLNNYLRVLDRGMDIGYMQGLRYIFTCVVQHCRFRCYRSEWKRFDMEYVNNDDWRALRDFFPINVAYEENPAFRRCEGEAKVNRPATSTMSNEERAERRTLAATLSTAASVLRNEDSAITMDHVLESHRQIRHNSIRGPMDFGDDASLAGDDCDECPSYSPILNDVKEGEGDINQPVLL